MSKVIVVLEVETADGEPDQEDYAVQIVHNSIIASDRERTKQHLMKVVGVYVPR